MKVGDLVKFQQSYIQSHGDMKYPCPASGMIVKTIISIGDTRGLLYVLWDDGTIDCKHVSELEVINESW
jgi:hypothetical protein